MENKETLEELRPGEAQPAPETEERRAEPEENARRAFIERDARQFRRQYPLVDLRELDADPMFRLFCGSRYGAEPLADLYGDYLALQALAGENARRREADVSRVERATGSGGSGGYDALTSAEQRELNEWNRAYPHMKMSAREYKARG